MLIGFAEALSAPEVVWSLADKGFSVVAFGRKGRVSALHHSRHVTCHEITAPESDFQAALSDLHSLLVSIGGKDPAIRRLLFPLDDTAVWLCSRARLPHPWILAGPVGDTAELALNKYLQTQLAGESGFDVPKTLLANTAADIYRFVDGQSFPIILKPANCVLADQRRLIKCRKWTCATHRELENAVKEWRERVPLLVQPFITGTGEGVFGIAAAEGVRAWSGHRRLRMMNPQGSGSSACISQPISDDLKSKVAAFVRKAEWRGLFMIELLRDHSGTAWFVELNGRPWGSMALSRRQGFEYPAWHVMLTLDQQSQAGVLSSSASGVVCRNVGREFMHLLFVLRGPKSDALTEWPSFWKTMSEVVRIRKGDTVYNWRREDPKVFVADCYNTIHDNLFKSRA